MTRSFGLLLVAVLAVVAASNNDTLEMELESNITVVKLDHGIKFSAHSEFALPENATLNNATDSDSEEAHDPAGAILTQRVRRASSNGENPEAVRRKRAVTTKKATALKLTTKKVGTTPKKGTTKTVKKTTNKGKSTTKKAKTTTKKVKVTTKKTVKKTTKRRKTTRKATTKAKTTTSTTTARPTPVINHRPPPEQPTEQKATPYPQTRRTFRMYDEDEQDADKKEIKQRG